MDSTKRLRHLEREFTFASHQVVLLNLDMKELQVHCEKKLNSSKSSPKERKGILKILRKKICRSLQKKNMKRLALLENMRNNFYEYSQIKMDEMAAERSRLRVEYLLDEEEEYQVEEDYVHESNEEYEEWLGEDFIKVEESNDN